MLGWSFGCRIKSRTLRSSGKRVRSSERQIIDKWNNEDNDLIIIAKTSIISGPKIVANLPP